MPSCCSEVKGGGDGDQSFCERICHKYFIDNSANCIIKLGGMHFALFMFKVTDVFSFFFRHDNLPREAQAVAGILAAGN